MTAFMNKYQYNHSPFHMYFFIIESSYSSSLPDYYFSLNFYSSFFDDFLLASGFSAFFIFYSLTCFYSEFLSFYAPFDSK